MTMSLVTPAEGRVVVVQKDLAEVVGGGPATIRLLADSSATGGAFSVVAVGLARGADGARPHFHAGSAELFYVLEGAVQILAGEGVVAARKGDLVVVPPRMAHAFAAAPAEEAELLIVLSPAVERFEYFRQLARIAAGKAPLESLPELQDRFDNHFLDSEAWRAARTR